ncbi:MAG: menaquinone-specific isochorismate synthase [Paracoccaceae bacterium]|jgi:menaquinone-specific isochorismate synthase
MERAVFGTRTGEVLVGYGPFTTFAEPPSAGVAFYRNDFSLSEEKPWLVPDRVEVLEKAPVAGAVEIDWEEPDPAGFAEVFREVSDAIGQGVLEKSVPVVTAKGKGLCSPDDLLASLLEVPETLRPYGWIGEEGGFLGATPEVLFRYFDGRIYTMALAGTARSDERILFAIDDKEIREHEFVAQTLIAKLSDLGMVIRNERGILDLGKLIHFQTLIKVELYKYEEIKRLIERLHPTPALGPLPRTTATMDLLKDWRARLDCPVEFGAPFGLLRDGDFEALVAIRMVSWRGDEFSLPSGCGVIQESRLVSEWRELALKREAVRDLFFSKS